MYSHLLGCTSEGEIYNRWADGLVYFPPRGHLAGATPLFSVGPGRIEVPVLCVVCCVLMLCVDVDVDVDDVWKDDWDPTWLGPHSKPRLAADRGQNGIT
jgi:hypothetical protein